MMPSAPTADSDLLVVAALAAEFTHALRTPLGALLSALEVASLPGVTDAQRTDACETALRQQAQLTRLIEGYETYWRLVAGSAPAAGAEPVDLSALVQDAVSACPPWRSAARIAIAPGVRVDGHAESLRHAVDAAVQHASSTAVSLSLACGGRPRQAVLRLASDARYGGGHPAAAAPARHRLSLRLAGEVVRLHGGTLDEHHAAGGATLTLFLPARG